MNKQLLVALLLFPLITLGNEVNESTEQSMRLSRSIEHDSRAVLSSEVIEQKLEQAEKTINLPISTTPKTDTRALTTLHTSSDYWINVFDTEVSTDHDLDGFYQRFTLSFQPDLAYGYDNVYADIYVSYEGNTWDYLTSTGNHSIRAGDYNEVIHVTTVLDYGYPAGYYDVLIELRDSSTDQLLTSTGPDSEGALALLPLEDEYYDDHYYDSNVSVGYYVHGSGSMGLTPLLLGGGLFGMRRIIKTIQF